MGDPVLEWYAAPDAPAPLSGVDYGAVDAGARSPVKRLFLFNNKDRTGAAAAFDLRYSTYDTAQGGEAGDAVRQRWLEVRAASLDGDPVEDPDGGFKAVGGPEHVKHLGLSLLNGTYLELETRVAMPADPAPGARSFVQRVEFKFV